MRTATTVPITEARRRLFEIARAVQKPGVQYTLTEHGKPTVTILSAKEYEKLSQTDVPRRDVLAKPLEFSGASGQLSPLMTPLMRSRMMPIAVCETSSRVYGADASDNAAYYAKELAKAWLYVSLVETYGYPGELVDIGRWVRVGGEGSRMYIEADLIVDDHAHDRLIICAVAGEPWYEERQAAALEELFALQGALPARSEVFLTYYTRGTRPDRAKARAHTRGGECWLVIDGTLYPTLSVWQSAGAPTEPSLPHC